jgi:RNA polymerase sigma-70 factor, ECF subfamily
MQIATPNGDDSFNNPELCEDDLLVNEFQKTHDNRYFTTLIQRYGSLIRSVCRRTLARWNVRDVRLLEDFTQEAFETAFTNIHLYTPQYQPGAFPAWLSVIARNRCYDFLRAIHTSKRNIAAEEPLYDVDRYPDSNSTASLLNRRIDCDRILNALRPSDRQIMISLYIYGWTIEELAIQHQIEPGAMRVRLHRIQNRLRKRFIR